MVFRIIALTTLLLIVSKVHSQGNYDSLKSAIINLDSRIDEVQLNLENSQKKFKSGILIATIGYTTTIAGGLMLGRNNDETGQALLVVGGVTGAIGTYKLVDAFSYLTGKRKKRKP